ncbi:Protein of unknown function [Pyronema omphalodes CBS 100304]
MAVLK